VRFTMEDSQTGPTNEDDRPRSIEITPPMDSESSDGEVPGVGILSGDVVSNWSEEGGVLGATSPVENGGLSNGAWFFIGMILAPAAIWIFSMLFFFLGDLTYELGIPGFEEAFYTIGMLVWPVGIIGCVVWGFTRGNKNFAYGVLVTMVAAPSICLLAVLFMVVIANNW
tara:strand:- start:2534 stop:3040 length:507 start_codon:yes stop_codon:yes gene_type:complete